MKTYLVAALLFAASSAQGMVYTWKDHNGVAYYTNKEYEIPARYRAKVKALYPEQADTVSAQKSSPAPQPIQEVPSPQPPAQQIAPPAPQPPAVAPPTHAPTIPSGTGRRKRLPSTSEE